MSWVFDGDALKVALVLGCRPDREVIGIWHYALAHADLEREFVPQAEILSFASPKESIQRKGDPGYAPCGFPVLLKICGGCGTRGLQPLKQSSPTAPQLSAMLGAPHGSPSVAAQAIFAYGWR